jgi:uncharacterized protein YrzB (UPF0473 family)
MLRGKFMDNKLDTITLYGEAGEEVEFQVITKIDIEDKEYFIVVPIDENENENENENDEAIALRVTKNETGEEVFVVVEDDDEFSMVSEVYESIVSEDLLN